MNLNLDGEIIYIERSGQFENVIVKLKLMKPKPPLANDIPYWKTKEEQEVVKKEIEQLRQEFEQEKKNFAKLHLGDVEITLKYKEK